MLASDFAAASVLISFGVVIGKTSPLQLIVMGLIEIVIFVANEVIGRSHFGVNTFFLYENLPNLCSNNFCKFFGHEFE